MPAIGRRSRSWTPSRNSDGDDGGGVDVDDDDGDDDDDVDDDGWPAKAGQSCPGDA